MLPGEKYVKSTLLKISGAFSNAGSGFCSSPSRLSLRGPRLLLATSRIPTGPAHCYWLCHSEYQNRTSDRR
jgi:hypothetical protein